jgi:hypothetical protein
MLGALAPLWPDSARTKIPIAKMAVTQKINRAALDIFILLVFFYAPASGISLFRIAAAALRSVPGYCAGACEEGKQNFLPNDKTSDLSVISD